MGGQGMDTLTGELADIGEKSIPEMPEMILGFYSIADGIKGFLGHLLVLDSYGPIVSRKQEGLSILTLKHHL